MNDYRKSGLFTRDEIEELVIMTRLELYNRGYFCGLKAILNRMAQLNVQPLPSLRTISRIINRNDLTHGRTGRYDQEG